MALLRHDCGLWLKLGEGIVAFRRDKGGPKLVGEDQLALLRRECSPKLVGKGVPPLALLRCLVGPSLERRAILGISASDVRPLVNKWERFSMGIAAL